MDTMDVEVVGTVSTAASDSGSDVRFSEISNSLVCSLLASSSIQHSLNFGKLTAARSDSLLSSVSAKWVLIAWNIKLRLFQYKSWKNPQKQQIKELLLLLLTLLKLSL